MRVFYSILICCSFFTVCLTASVKYCKNYRSVADVIRQASLLFIERPNKTQCCDLIGCFSIEKGSKWERWLDLPSCLDVINPQFYIYTAENPNLNQTVDIFDLDKSVEKLDISKNKELFLIIHGWNTVWDQNAFMFPMKDALLNQGYNAMIVRWSNGSNIKFYPKAAANTQAVGLAVSLVLSKMVDKGKADLSSTTIIGFSLGAQTAGFAGANLTNLKRIIGLDPAGPLFDCENNDTRLSSNDAKFVQIIHTSAAGERSDIGHVDFYANGLIQPGCEDKDTQSISKSFSINDLFNDTTCSHGRAYNLLIEMIKKTKTNADKCSFRGYPCNDSETFHNGQCFECPKHGCPTPGLNMDVGTEYSGSYYFNTQNDETEEFCGRPYRITFEANSDVDGKIDVVLSGPRGKTQTLRFQSSSTMSKGQPKRRIMMTPWNIDSLNEIKLNYTRSEGLLFGLIGGGNDKFKISNASIEDTNGNIKILCSAVDVVTGKPVAISFSPCK